MFFSLGLILLLFLFLLSACGDSEQDLDLTSLKDKGTTDVMKPDEVELYYDDGTMEAHHSPWVDETGGQLAVVFTPPFYPAVLKKARFLVGLSGIPTTLFRVRVFGGSVSSGPNESQNLLKSEVTTSALFGHQWVEVDLSDQDITITSGDFFISMEWLTPPGDRGDNAQMLGVDYSNPDGRSWWKTSRNRDWIRIEEVADIGDRDCMIRAILSSQEKKGTETDSYVSGIVSANTTFGFKLFKELIKPDSTSNIFVSPYSISTALAMTCNGAADETRRAMAETLELQDFSLVRINEENARLRDSLMNPDSGIRLNTANSLWADEGIDFKSNFIKTNNAYYDAKITNLDLTNPASLGIINDWIKEKTEGRIDEIIDSQDLNAILFLINAVYFKGNWTVGFSKEHTQDKDFHLLDGSRKKVPMMMSQSDKYTYFLGEGFQAVGLPYGNERMSLYLFLPDEKSSLQEFLKKLNRDNWESWMPEFRRELVQVTLPRLKLEYDIELNDVLKSLGMGNAFTPEANFEKMCTGSAFIDMVVHNAYVEVNEEGTEAGAATVVKMKQGVRQAVSFDRPFFCAIRDNLTGSILFMGLVVEP